jgi:exopolysaccharide biosynthesis polyprenyl glycosylphosphotransferase
MKRSSRLLVTLRVICDSVAVVASWLLSGFLRFYIIPGGWTPSFNQFVQLSAVVWAFNIFFLSNGGLYVEELDHSWRKETTKLVANTFKAYLLLVVVLYFIYANKVSRIAVMLHFFLSVIFLVTERTLISAFIKHSYRKGRFTRRVLFAGFGQKLADYRKALNSDEVEGITIVGQYGSEGKGEAGLRLIDAATLADAVRETKPDLVVIGYPPAEHDRQQAMVAQAQDLLTEKVVLLPSIPESYIGTKISDFRWLPQMTLNAADIGLFQRMSKRIFDIVASLVGIIILSPLLLLIALLVKLTSKGPVIYRQKRITRDEKVFTMYKFRSMRIDMSEGDTARWTEENDPRVTKIGRFIRRTSIDELPQLFNVLEGSMSLIGPRPERPELVERFNTEIPGYRMRHRFKAGVSGWAQVNGWRGNTSLERRIEFDLFYIRNWSFFFDLKIVLFTFFRGFVNENAY